MGRDIKAGGAFVEIFGKDAGLKKALSDSQKKLLKFANGATAIGKNIFKGLGALAIPSIFATKLLVNFSDKMLEVKAVTQATAKEFADLNTEARRLGATTSFTAEQVAGAMAELGRAGFGPEQIIAALDSILALSRATSTDLAEATKIATSTLRQFGLAAGDAGRVADILTATANNSALTLTELGESLKFVGPIAKAAGASLTTISAALGILANNGIKGTVAGTSLARAFKNLSKEAKQVNLEKVTGIEITDLSNIDKVLRDIGDATKDLSKVKRLAIFEEIFGRGQIAALTLAKPSAVFDDLKDKIENLAGVAKRTSDIMDSGLGGVLRRLLSAAQDLGIEFGESLKPLLEGFIVEIRKAIPIVSEFIKENGAVINSFIKWAAILGTTAIAVGLVSKSVLLLSTTVAGIRSLIPVIIKFTSLLTLDGVADGISGVVRGLGRGILAVGKFAAANKLLTLRLGILAVGIGIATKLIIDYRKAVGDAVDELDKLSKKISIDIAQANDSIVKSQAEILKLQKEIAKGGLSEFELAQKKLRLAENELNLKKKEREIVGGELSKVQIKEERATVGLFDRIRRGTDLETLGERSARTDARIEKEILEERSVLLSKEINVIALRNAELKKQADNITREEDLTDKLLQERLLADKLSKSSLKSFDKTTKGILDEISKKEAKSIEAEERIRGPEEGLTEFEKRIRDINVRTQKQSAALKLNTEFEKQKEKIEKADISELDKPFLTVDLEEALLRDIETINKEIERTEENNLARRLNAIDREKEAVVRSTLDEIRQRDDLSDIIKADLIAQAKQLAQNKKLSPEELEKRLGQIEAGPREIIDKTQARGAFSARALQALTRSGEKIQDKILKENKKTAENTAKLVTKKGNTF